MDKMSMIDAVKSVLSNYANFSGRARRSEYWWFVLFNVIVSVVLSLLASITGSSIFGGLSTLYMIAIIIPSLAVEVRRLHDTGKRGWWLFLSLIPIVGAIILLIWMCTEGKPGPNQFGENPKDDIETIEF